MNRYLKLFKKLQNSIKPVPDAHNILFSPKSSSMRLLDFSGILRNRFGIQKKYAPDLNLLSKENYLSLNEKKLILAMVQDPEANLKELANQAALSLPTVSKLKNILVNEKIVLPVNLPNFTKIGMELLCIAYGEPVQPEEQVFFEIRSTKNNVSLALYKDYTDYSRKNNVETDNHKILSLEDIPYMNLKLLPLTEELFKRG